MKTAEEIAAIWIDGLSCTIDPINPNKQRLASDFKEYSNQQLAEYKEKLKGKLKGMFYENSIEKYDAGYDSAIEDVIELIDADNKPHYETDQVFKGTFGPKGSDAKEPIPQDVKTISQVATVMLKDAAQELKSLRYQLAAKDGLRLKDAQTLGRLATKINVLEEQLAAKKKECSDVREAWNETGKQWRETSDQLKQRDETIKELKEQNAGLSNTLALCDDADILKGWKESVLLRDKIVGELLDLITYLDKDGYCDDHYCVVDRAKELLGIKAIED